jgi:hypothetical protein
LEEFFEDYAELSQSHASVPEELAAIIPDTGEHFMERFGWMGSVRNFMKTYGGSEDEWVAKSAVFIHQLMLMDKREADYQRRYHEIINQRR